MSESGGSDERAAAADDVREDLELNDETADSIRGGVQGWPKKLGGPGPVTTDPPPTQK